MWYNSNLKFQLNSVEIHWWPWKVVSNNRMPWGRSPPIRQTNPLFDYVIPLLQWLALLLTAFPPDSRSGPVYCCSSSSVSEYFTTGFRACEKFFHRWLAHSSRLLTAASRPVVDIFRNGFRTSKQQHFLRCYYEQSTLHASIWPDRKWTRKWRCRTSRSAYKAERIVWFRMTSSATNPSSAGCLTKCYGTDW